jgi:hypothetical protein
VDVRADIAAIAVLHGFEGERSGFVLFDATKPDDLTPLGRWQAPIPTVYAADVKLSDDGKWAFLATQRNGILPFSTLSEMGRDVPTLPVYPYSPNNGADVGVYVVDISNRMMPRTALFFPVETNGVHMMDVQSVGGVTYLFLQASTVYPRCVASGTPACLPDSVQLPGAGIRVDIAEFTAGPPGPQIRVVQTYQATEGHYIHDITVQDDPLLGKTLMYVAHWDDGVHIVDVSNLPGAVTRLGQWSPDKLDEEDEADLLGHIHTVWSDIVGEEGAEKRIVVGSPEFGFRIGQPPISILDATDETMPVEIGNWSLPCPEDACMFMQDMDPVPEYRWSTHNIVIEHGLLYLSQFHGGVWVFDLTVDLANPTVIGYTMLAPQDRGPGAFGGLINDSPSVWDAVPYMGTIWISDINGGMYTAKLVELPEHVLAMDAMEGMDHGQ